MKSKFNILLDRLLVGLILTLVLAGILSVVFPLTKGLKGFLKRSPDKGSAEWILESADSQTVKAYQRFEQQMEQITSSAEVEQSFRSAIQKISDELSNSKGMLNLVGLMAKDKLKGGDRATRHIQKQVRQELAEPTELLAEEIQHALQTLEGDLSAIRGTTAKQLRIPLTNAGADLLEWDTALKQLGISATISGIMLPVDVVLVACTRLVQRLTASVVATSSRLLGKSVGRASIAGVAPFIDGPLPVGDVVAGIGLAWTAIEIKGAQTRFRQAIVQNVQVEIGRLQTHLLQQAKEISTRCVLGHQRRQRELEKVVRYLTQPTPQPRASP
ncbi:hypothetical protein P0Y35_14320 [Kiritimatiellaeota bacterium B1221]|nr:hypothetical protein [Kiritimatiellaeota bacterium B1221]